MPDKPSPIHLIKLLLVSIYRVVAIIVKNNWEPFYTTTVKMAIIALVLWGITTIIPHGITFLDSISYLGWLTIIILYRLVTLKYDDFEEPELAEIQEEDDDTEEIEEIKPTPSIRNVIDRKEIEDEYTSTRE